AQALVLSGHLTRQGDNLLIDPDGGLVHGLSGARQRIAIRQPLKEPDTQTFLEGAETAKHGRVRYAKAACCSRQRARPGHSEEKAQIVPVLVLCIHEGSPLASLLRLPAGCPHLARNTARSHCLVRKA